MIGEKKGLGMRVTGREGVKQVTCHWRALQLIEVPRRDA